jgi:tyrosine-specific transport protein
MHLIRRFGHLFGASLLVTGTSIGVGILGLPLATAAGGFIPSLFVYIASWLFMVSTGLLVLEACLWHPKGANFITLSGHLLGKTGKICCWILYIYLFYCLIIAHLASGGSAFHAITGGWIPQWAGSILYTLIFVPVVYMGTLWVDRLNIVLLLGALITYLLFLVAGVPFIDFSLLSRMEWGKAVGALPVIFTAFGFQNLIPTLVTYLQGDGKKVRAAIWIGTTLPLIVYLIWQFMILGIIPFEGAGGLLEAYRKGQSAVQPLSSLLNKTFLSDVGQAFAFFIMTASFVGIAIAFVDFLSDGLHIAKKGVNKLGLCVLIFIFPLLITLIDPSIFLKALSLAGGIGAALLFGIMPVLMIYRGRYQMKLAKVHERLPGGKILLSAIFLFALFELMLEIFS